MKKLTLTPTRRAKIVGILNVVKFILIVLLFLMFVTFNAKVARQNENIQKIAQSTNDVVKSQGDILAAIKQVTEDTRVTAQEQTAIIICMLQVPVEQRTTDFQTKCRNSVITTDVDGGNNTGTTDRGSGDAGGSSTNNTPASPSSLSETSPERREPETASPASPEPTEPEEPEPSFLERLLAPIINLFNGGQGVQ